MKQKSSNIGGIVEFVLDCTEVAGEDWHTRPRFPGLLTSVAPPASPLLWETHRVICIQYAECAGRELLDRRDAAHPGLSLFVGERDIMEGFGGGDGPEEAERHGRRAAHYTVEHNREQPMTLDFRAHIVS